MFQLEMAPIFSTNIWMGTVVILRWGKIWKSVQQMEASLRIKSLCPVAAKTRYHKPSKNFILIISFNNSYIIMDVVGGICFPLHSMNTRLLEYLNQDTNIWAPPLHLWSIAQMLDFPWLSPAFPRPSHISGCEGSAMDTEKLHSATARLAAARATWSTTSPRCWRSLCGDDDRD